MTTAFFFRRQRRALLLLLALSLLAPGLRAEGAITVFAAASLREALESQAAAYAAEGHRAPRLVFAASSTLARQLSAGAEAQLFLSADERWMAYLEEARPLSSTPLLGNRLALLARKGTQPPCEAPEPCLRSLPERLSEGGRLALGDPQHVPAGRYGQAALTYYGLLTALKGQLLPADSVRTALAWVARGEAPLGLGYASDARVLPALEALAIIPAEAHPPIIYPLGRLLDASQQGDALAFEAFLRSPRARAAWEAAGFTLLASPPIMMGEVEILATLLSLKVAAVAVLGSLPLALLVATRLARGGRGTLLLDALVHLPLVLPPVVVGYLLLITLGTQAPLGGWLKDMLGLRLVFHWTGAALAAAVVTFPFQVRALRLALEAIDPGLYRAAQSLGLSPWARFRRVTFPLALPGLLAGAITAFAAALGEFGAIMTFAANIPGETQTLPLAIYSALQTPGGEGAAGRLVALAIALALAGLLLGEGAARQLRARTGRTLGSLR